MTIYVSVKIQIFGGSQICDWSMLINNMSDFLSNCVLWYLCKAALSESSYLIDGFDFILPNGYKCGTWVYFALVLSFTETLVCML